MISFDDKCVIEESDHGDVVKFLFVVNELNAGGEIQRLQGIVDRIRQAVRFVKRPKHDGTIVCEVEFDEIHNCVHVVYPHTTELQFHTPFQLILQIHANIDGTTVFFRSSDPVFESGDVVFFENTF